MIPHLLGLQPIRLPTGQLITLPPLNYALPVQQTARNAQTHEKKVTDILAALSPHPKTIREIGEAADVARNTTTKILNELIADGRVVREGETRNKYRYRLAKK